MAAPMLICQTVLCLLSSQAALNTSKLLQSQQFLQANISRPLSSSPPISVSYTSPKKAISTANDTNDDGHDETLNSDKSQSASWTSPTAAESGGSWPPLIVASENAQRFFDRIHGFAEKPVSDEENNGGVTTTTGSATAKTMTTTKHIVNTQQFDDLHANTIDSEVLTTTTPRAQSKANEEATLKNWIYTHPSVPSSNRPLARVRKSIPLTEAKIQTDESRQMLTSLSERIFANLAANNPYVNWTQSPTPQAVYSLANLPIAQMPFVYLGSSTPSPQRTEKPPRKGWFSFASRPLRIYGEGTESKFPPLIERMVQRIQHYFSVFKYEDTSRPLASEGGSNSPVVSTINVQTNNDGLDELLVEVKPLTEGSEESKPSGDFVVYIGNFNLDDENSELAFEQVTTENGELNIFDEEEHTNKDEIVTTEDVNSAKITTELSVSAQADETSENTGSPDLAESLSEINLDSTTDNVDDTTAGLLKIIGDTTKLTRKLNVLSTNFKTHSDTDKNSVTKTKSHSDNLV